MKGRASWKPALGVKDQLGGGIEKIFMIVHGTETVLFHGKKGIELLKPLPQKKTKLPDI